MTQTIPSNLVFGCPFTNQLKPLEGFPSGRIKLRFRSDDFLYAYVKTKEGIQKWSVKEENDKWKPHYLIAQNNNL